ncbi:MAG: hypothetical protein CMO55_27975 [Verrucomicrobiales bacterium]|nr:hypothetical protein [Verrucomicrobiales bacterium]
MRLKTSLTILTLALSPALLRSADVEALKFFENHVRPLLSAECYDCHGPEKEKGGLRLDHKDHILKGGGTGPAIVVGKPDDSLLVEAIRRDDPDFAMPPKKELTEEQVSTLEQWIAMGAPWPAEAADKSDLDENGFSSEDHAWWAVQPLAEVTVPDNGTEWAKNEIDHFIARKLEEKQLQPAETADSIELVRRIYFDLHGLPPTADEANAFQSAYKENPDKAISDLVDKLLDSPRYGERWGQHWLDVVRYAESDGYRADGYRPDTYRYRDYVIQSFNEDKPYTQFVKEQLAADEFAADDPDKFIATAFLRLGIYEYNQRNAEMHWDIIMTEMTNVTGEAFLGLGIGCAQCHDHKFDPILQKDHFALRAFLSSTWWPEHEVLATPEEKAEYDKQMAAWEAKAGEIQAQIDEMQKARLESAQKGSVKQFPENVQEIYWKPAEERNAYEEQIAQLVQRQVEWSQGRVDWKKTFASDKEKLAKYEDLTKKLKEFEDLKPKPLPTAFISTDTGPEAAATYIEKRGKKEEVEPAYLTLLDLPAPKIKPTEETTGRRLALANWIASEDNPLSTRVITNRIWQHHFGTGLVPTPNDFGQLGEEPSHPELLDWLTEEFIEGGWKMKPMHKLIMMSAAYRQTAKREPTSDESMTDPENRLLWRFPPRRLSAEEIRDAMLVASGELQQKEGGPAVSGSSTNRSVYVKKIRNTKDPMMGAFDMPSGFSSSPNRTETTTPTQSLLLVNGDFAMKRANAFAKSILGGKTSIDEATVREAYRAAYGREPERIEVDGALAFINNQMNAVEGPKAPAPKYPDENGLRPITQHFKAGQSLDLGEKSLWLQPGSRFERLQATELELTGDEFTIEAVANLDSIHKDASVNTLFSRWNGNHKDSGFTFGVTSEKSRYEPRNFIMQLIGDDFQGNRIYDVVASDLRFPLSKPVYIAASVKAQPAKDDVTKGSVTFYMKDLSDPKAPLQSKTVPHDIVGGLHADKAIRSFISGRDQSGHLWDGQLARLVVSKGALPKEKLIIEKPDGRDRIIDWKFNGPEGAHPEPNTAWVKEPAKPSSQSNSPLFGAVTDFCHVLLNSNEFLYLH